MLSLVHHAISAFDFCCGPVGPLKLPPVLCSVSATRSCRFPLADSEGGLKRFPGSRSKGPSDPQLLHREHGPPAGQAAEDGKFLLVAAVRECIIGWSALFLPGDMTGGHPHAGKPSGGDASEVDRQEPPAGQRARLQGEIPECWLPKMTASGLWAEFFMAVGHAQLQRIAHERERNSCEEAKLATATDSFRQVRLTCPTSGLPFGRFLLRSSAPAGLMKEAGTS